MFVKRWDSGSVGSAGFWLGNFALVAIPSPKLGSTCAGPVLAVNSLSWEVWFLLV